MSQPEVYRYLESLIIDDRLKEIAATDLEASIQGFDLTESEVAWLKTRMTTPVLQREQERTLSSESTEGMSRYFASIPNEPNILNLFELGSGRLPGVSQSFDVAPIIVIPPPPVTITTISVTPTPSPTPTVTTGIVANLALQNALSKNNQDLPTAIAAVVKDVKENSEGRVEKLAVLAALLEMA